MGLGRKRYGVLASARARGEVQEARGLTLEACEAVAKQEVDGGGRNRAVKPAGAKEETGTTTTIGASPVRFLARGQRREQGGAGGGLGLA